MTDVHFDYNTTNHSFIDMANFLKQRGVKNHNFMLSLHDKTLLGVNPHGIHSDNQEMIARIHHECRDNIWYFLRECVRVNQAGGASSEFRLNRASCAMVWSLINGLDQFAIIPRQMGGLTTEVCLASWYMFCKSSESTAIALLRDNSSGDQFAERMVSTGISLPLFLQENRDILQKAGAVEFVPTRTKCEVIRARSDHRKSEMMARGLSGEMILIDEFNYIKGIDIIFPSLLSSCFTSRTVAMSRGNLAPLVIVGKPPVTDEDILGLNGLKAENIYAENVLHGAFPFTEALYDLPTEQSVVDYVKLLCPSGMVKIEFTAIELGHTFQWLENTIERNALPLSKILSEYLGISLLENV